MPDQAAAEPARLDTWLDRACLFKTRSAAQRACRASQVEVNGQPAKPRRAIAPGDVIVIRRPFDRRQTVVVRALAETHVAKAAARELYEDRTPQKSPEEIALARAERVFRAAQTAAGPPDKRQRRALRRARGY